MLTRYIDAAMKRAKVKRLADGTLFAEIPGLEGVWANERTEEECLVVLREVLEEWLVLKLRDNDPIPLMGRVALAEKPAARAATRKAA